MWDHRLLKLVLIHPMARNAFVTLLSQASYLPGTLVLHHSLQATQTIYPLIIMITRSLPEKSRQVLDSLGIPVREVEALHLPAQRYDQSQTEERFTEIWTKLR
jgi:hypothetical protein